MLFAQSRRETADFKEVRRPPKATQYRTIALVWSLLGMSGLFGSTPSFTVLEIEDQAPLRFAERTLNGAEVAGAPRGARRQVPALSQFDYPEPDSACGPVAMLNWLLWLDRYRVLKPTGRTTRPIPTAALVEEIERTFREIRGNDSEPARGGTHPLEIAVAMDRIVNRRTGGEIRLSPRVIEAPVKIAELMEFMRGFRCGMLITRIVADPQSNAFGEYHAVNFVAADRSGGLMINNWGTQVYGVLRNERDGQFFRSENTEHPALKIDYAICFLPFRTEAPGSGGGIIEVLSD